ncbi:MAG: murein biosynthesis integral membrane protein MurJ [Alphaproteobacteria bacterium]|nr:murein biosynthesis integral membrane protein MurJ [Alphaproteobacteria bacterium]
MSFARSLVTVSGFTMISRLAGFVRDMLTAVFLGVGMHADAFFVAQRLPNLFRSLFAEGAFSAAFVPLYTHTSERYGEEEAQKFAGQALALMIMILLPFTLLMISAMPFVILVMAPGFQSGSEKFALAVSYSRITFPYLLLISVTALQSGVLNARGFFAPGAFAPIILNLTLITALYFANFLNLSVSKTLAYAFTLSGALQVLWLTLSCWRARALIKLVWPYGAQACKTLFKQIGPGAIGAGATQINLLMTTILASLLPTGAVSYLYYADRLHQLPLGIIGIAIATTLLPVLSRHETRGESEDVSHYTCRAIEFCLVLGLPASIGLGLAAQPIIQALFEHGAFTHEDTIQTARTLSAYAAGVPAFLLAKIFAARFFARQDTKTPVKVAMIAIISNILLAFILMRFWEHVGMAAATSCATWLNASLLYILLRKAKAIRADAILKRKAPRMLLSALGMALATALLVAGTRDLFEENLFWRPIFGLAAIIGLSGLVYIVLLQLSGAMTVRELREHATFKKH